MPRSIQAALLAASIATSAAACLSAGDTACTHDSECLQGERCDSTTSVCMPELGSGTDAGVEARDAGTQQNQNGQQVAQDAGTAADAGTEPTDAGTIVEPAPWALLEARTTVTRLGRSIDIANRTAAEVLAKTPVASKCAKLFDECCFTTTPPEPEFGKSLNAGTIAVVGKGTKGSLRYESGSYAKASLELPEGEKFAAEAAGGPDADAVSFPSGTLPPEPQIIVPDATASTVPPTVSGKGFDVKWTPGQKGDDVVVGITALEPKTGAMGMSVRCRTADTGGYRMEKLLEQFTDGPVAITVERAVETEVEVRSGVRKTRGVTVSRIGVSLK